MRLENKNGVYAILIVIALLWVVFILSQQHNYLTGYASENPFNLEIEIPPEHQNVIAGDSLWFTTKILNFANENRVDVTLDYSVVDSNQEKIITKSETVAIETQASFVGQINLPEDSPPGDYMLVVDMIQANGNVSTGKISFKIKTEENLNSLFQKYKLFIFIGIVILILIGFFTWIFPILKTRFENRTIRKKIKEMVKRRSFY
jgi:methionine-rich copper-binding protein CopC